MSLRNNIDKFTRKYYRQQDKKAQLIGKNPGVPGVIDTSPDNTSIGGKRGKTAYNKHLIEFYEGKGLLPEPVWIPRYVPARLDPVSKIGRIFTCENCQRKNTVSAEIVQNYDIERKCLVFQAKFFCEACLWQLRRRWDIADSEARHINMGNLGVTLAKGGAIPN
jgi:hypothetical protein